MPNPKETHMPPNTRLLDLLGIKPADKPSLDAILPRAKVDGTLTTATKPSDAPVDAACKSSSTGTESGTPGPATSGGNLPTTQKRLQFVTRKTTSKNSIDACESPVSTAPSDVPHKTVTKRTVKTRRKTSRRKVTRKSATGKPLDPRLTSRGTVRKNKIPRMRTGGRFADYVPERLTGSMVSAWRNTCELSKAQASRLLGVSRGSYRDFEADGVTMKRTILAMRAIHAHLHLQRLHAWEIGDRLKPTTDSTLPE